MESDDQLERSPTGLHDLQLTLSGRYSLHNEIGAGGMANVYLADDVKHRRKVAIKVLRRDIGQSIGTDRFLREIRIAANLSHPHIVPLFDSGEASGLLYYVMPYIAGESLRQMLVREKQLPISYALTIAKQVAAALDYAHRQGVVHRDIKPENILLRDGLALVADFGIARAFEVSEKRRLTETNTFVGTPEYMSPEQAGDQRNVDGRTDVYALGCVLYETLAGEPPYTGPTSMAIFAKRLVDPVMPIRRVRPSVASAIDQAITKALAKTPADRLPTAAAFAASLDAPAVAIPARRSIAVLPFVNLSRDPQEEYFADGTTEDVIAQLSRIRALRVISRTSVMQFKNSRDSLHDIGTKLGVETVLEGSLRTTGNQLRIVAQLIDVQTDEHLWAETYDREMRDVLAVQSEIARSIAVALEINLTHIEDERLSTTGSVSPAAYDLLLRGREYVNRGNVAAQRIGMEFIRQAIDVSPDFAHSYAALAAGYSVQVDRFGESPSLLEPGLQAALRAIEIDPDLAEAHGALALVHMAAGRYTAARAALERAISISPGLAGAVGNYGKLNALIGRIDEAIEWTSRALSLDPQQNHIFSANIAFACAVLGLYNQADEYLTAARRFRPDFPQCLLIASSISLLKGDMVRAVADATMLAEQNPSAPFYLCNAGATHIYDGNYERARSYLERAWAAGTPSGAKHQDVRVLLAFALIELGKREQAKKLLANFDVYAAEEIRAGNESSTVFFSVAVAHALRGRRPEGLDMLKKAVAAGTIELPFIARNPAFAQLHAEPEFTRILDALQARLDEMRERAWRFLPKTLA